MDFYESFMKQYGGSGGNSSGPKPSSSSFYDSFMASNTGTRRSQSNPQSLINQYQESLKNSEDEENKKVNFQTVLKNAETGEDFEVQEEVDKNKILEIWDNQDEAGRRILAAKIREQAKAGDEASQQVNNWLEKEGRYDKGIAGEVGDFIESSNERFLGGLGRATARTADFLLPGDQSNLINTLNIQDRNEDLTRQTYSTGGRAGSAVGGTQKTLFDVFSMAAPAGAVDKAVKGTRAIQSLSQGSKLSRALGYGGRVVPGSLTASAVDIQQEIGRGNEPDYLRSAGIGLGADLALPLAGKLLKRGGGRAVTYLNEASPEFKAMNDSLKNAAQEAKESVKKTKWYRKLEDNLANPLAYTSRIDNATAKKMGISRDQLAASESVEALAERSANMRGATGVKTASNILDDFGITADMQKYTDEEGVAFNTYRNAKAALEHKQISGKDVSIGSGPDGSPMTQKDMQKYVDEYEQLNPEALKELVKYKKYHDFQTDRLVRAGVITEASAKELKKYQYYSPLDRVFPENVVRPDVNMSPLASGSQRSVQTIKSGAAQPVDNSFDALLRRGHLAEIDIAKAEFGNKFKQRVEQGVVDDAFVTQSKEDILKSRAKKEQLQELLDLEKKLKSERERAIRGRKAASTDVRYRQRDASNKAREILRDLVNDPDAEAAIGKLNSDELSEIVSNMANDRTPGTYSVNKQLVKSKAERDALMEEIDALDGALQDIKTGKADVREELLELSQDPITGKQTILVRDEGVPVRIEVPPQAAEVIQGMGDKKLDVVTKTVQMATKPFRAAFTGFANTAFSIVSFVAYDAPMGVINSRDGFKTLFSANGWKRAIKGMSSGDEFQKKLIGGGAITQTASMLPDSVVASPEYVAAKGNLLKKLKLSVSSKDNLQSLVNELDVVGGKLQGATRTRIASARYDDAIAKGLTDEQAIAEAVYAYNNVMPNYNKAGRVIKSIDAFLPYTAASVAGTRSAAQALRRRPISTLSKAAMVAAPIPAAVAYNMSHDAGEEFYKDMEENDRDYTLDNNYIIVLPGASKNQETGEWEGIIKIPVPPEFRAVTKAGWRETRDQITGQNEVGVREYANALFDTVTGGVFEDPSNPAIETAVGLRTNTNFNYDSDIVPESMQDLPLDEQVYDSTTQRAKDIAAALQVSPLQVQYVMDQFGAGGRLFSGESNPFEETVNRVFGARSASSDREWKNKFSDLIEEKDSLSKAINRDLKSDNLMEANQKAIEYNTKVQSLEQALLSNANMVDVSDSQLSLLESLSFPTNSQGLTSASVKARLK